MKKLLELGAKTQVHDVSGQFVDVDLNINTLNVRTLGSFHYNRLKLTLTLPAMGGFAHYIYSKAYKSKRS
jgi:hypothetical protein